MDGAAERRVEQGRGVAAVDDADRVVVLLAGSPSKTARPSSSSIGRSRIVTAIGGGGSSPATTALMYSMPVIVAPAAAVGTGSCQTSVRLRVVSGLTSAKCASADVPPRRRRLRATTCEAVASSLTGRSRWVAVARASRGRRLAG